MSKFRFSKQKKEYLAKSPHDKWFFVRNINTFMLTLFGCEFMEANYKFSIRSMTVVYLMVNYFGLLIYTLYYYWNDPYRALESTPASGVYLPVGLANNWTIEFLHQVKKILFLIIGLSIVHYNSEFINEQTISIYV